MAKRRCRGSSMIRKSGNHFCGKIMLKQLILREFFSTRRFHLVGTRASVTQTGPGVPGVGPLTETALTTA